MTKSQRERSSWCQSTSYERGRRRGVQCLTFSIHHLSVLQRADEYLPADECLKARWGVEGWGGGGIRAEMRTGT